MSLKLLKRLDVDARIAHVLLREQLIYGQQLAEVYSASSSGDLTTRLLASGVDGVCSSSSPQTFVSTSASFNATMVGKYLTLHDTVSANAGVHKIVGVPDSDTLIVQGGIYGSSFATDVSIAYRVIDPTGNTGDTEFTFQGATGTAPIWQARLFINASDSKRIRLELGPNGGFTGGTRSGTGDNLTVAGTDVTLTDAGATFSDTDLGRFITIAGATTGTNNGVFQITAVNSSTEVVFTNALGVTEAFPGTWSIEGIWTSTALTNKAIELDPAVNRWYCKLETTNLILWTENAAGTAPYNVAYIGAGSTRRPAVDSTFAVLAAGTSPSFLTSIKAIAVDDATPVTYQAIVFGDSSINNIFTSLPSNSFDLRNDSADIPIGCEEVGYEEEDRGILNGLQWISDQISYKSFVDNGRQLLSLGSGLAVEWDGSLSR